MRLSFYRPARVDTMCWYSALSLRSLLIVCGICNHAGRFQEFAFASQNTSADTYSGIGRGFSGVSANRAYLCCIDYRYPIASSKNNVERMALPKVWQCNEA